VSEDGKADGTQDAQELYEALLPGFTPPVDLRAAQAAIRGATKEPEKKPSQPVVSIVQQIPSPAWNAKAEELALAGWDVLERSGKRIWCRKREDPSSCWFDEEVAHEILEGRIPALDAD
jgi:hypothetical protein